MRNISLSIIVAAGLLFALFYFGDLLNIQRTFTSQTPPTTQTTECGAKGEACRVGTRRYNIALPIGKGPFPAVLFFHGSGGSGDHSIGLKTLLHPMIEANYALIAPSAEIIEYDNGVKQANWLWEGKRGNRDDYAFAADVLRDAARRFPIDGKRILVAGHSRGGTFVWYFACANKDHRLKAFAPHAGTPFIGWENDCAGKTPNYHLIHTHGSKDTIVNYHGTPEKPDWHARFGAEDAVADHARKLRCKSSMTRTHQTFDILTWKDCLGPYNPAFATFQGGHDLTSAWVNMAINWFEALPE